LVGGLPVGAVSWHHDFFRQQLAWQRRTTA
jgi:hypothetical protein